MIAPRLRFYLLLLIALVLVGDRAAGVDADAARVSLARFATKRAIRFEANVGQTDPQARFVAHRGRVAVFLGEERATLALRGNDGNDRTTSVLTMQVAGAEPVVPVGSGRLATKTSYYVGRDTSQWHVDVPSYARVTYPGVRKGIDLVFHGEEGQIEYDFIVAPGADVANAALEIGGADSVAVDEQGKLAMHTHRGTILQYRPRVFQRDPLKGEIEIAANYKLLGKTSVGFEVASYDHSKPLVIDPVFAFATYLGGTGEETGAVVALDPNGVSWVAGGASTPSFPGATTIATPGGASDAYVAKLSPRGEVLAYVYLGGAVDEAATSVAVEGNRVVVVGSTTSPDFPLSLDAYQSQRGGNTDAFVTILDGAGTLVYSSYLDLAFVPPCPAVCALVRDTDVAQGVAIRNGMVVVVGVSFFDTTGPLPSPAGEPNGAFAFAFSVNAPASPIYRRFLGGSDVLLGAVGPTSPFGSVGARGVVLDATGRAYLTGSADSSLVKEAGTVDGFASAARAIDFNTVLPPPVPPPPPPGPAPVLVEIGDAFVVRLSPTGAVEWRSFLGGSSFDAAIGITLTGDRNVAITGGTYSAGTELSGCTSADGFPTTSGAYLTSHPGPFTNATGLPAFPFLPAPKAFVARFDTGVSGAASLVFSTLLGGTTGDEAGSGVAYDAVNDSIYVIGSTTSTNFPTIPAFTRSTVDVETFLVRFDASGHLLDSTLYGGSDYDSPTGIAIQGSVLVFSGTTSSSDLPLLSPTQRLPNQGAPPPPPPGVAAADAFVVRIDLANIQVLDIAPRTATLKPGESQQFIVTGGSGAYAYTIEPNVSGGTIDPLGKYTAGSRGGIDTVVVRDSAGAVTFATVTVQAPTALFLTPRDINISPRGHVFFLATEGAPPYTFTFGSNLSGAAISPNGNYTAGARGSVADTIRVTDSAGATLDATVRVGAGIKITPAAPSVPRKGSLAFSARGGVGAGYSWSATAGTITNQGVFTAPSTSLPVTVTVRDPFGNTASVSVSVGGALAINPPEVSTIPGGHVTFSAAGGKGSGYSYVLLTSPPAGGAIDAGSGEFVAGPTGSVTETVQVSDPLGNRAIATVTVGPGPIVEPPPSTSSSSSSTSSSSSSSTSSTSSSGGTSSTTTSSSGNSAADTANLDGGGCNCNTSGGSSPLGAAAPIAIGLLFALRRRRRS